jgi:transcriptional regulator with XRE-family HTH domain
MAYDRVTSEVLVHPSSTDPDPSATLVSQYRRQRGISVADLARLLSVSKTTANRWDKGHCVPQERFRVALAEALEADLRDLCSGWGVPLASSNVVPLHPDGGQATPRPAEVEPSQRQFVNAILQGIRKGHATSDNWLAACEATARLLGIPWQPVQRDKP